MAQDASTDSDRPHESATQPSTPRSRLSEHSVLLELMPHIMRTFRREPALTFTFAYVLVALAGIFFNYSYYHAFAIPVLTLSQINDFLVAGIQEPMALLIVLLMFPLVWIFDWINARARRRTAAKLRDLRASDATGRSHRFRVAYLTWRVERMWYMRLVYIAVIMAYGWLFVGAYANYRADIVKRGDAPHVLVYLSGDNTTLPSQSKSWTYLGTTFNYVFLYDHVSHHTEILPVNNIKRIEPVTLDRQTGQLVAPIH